MSAGRDPRLTSFVRGELVGAELAALEEELDRRPSLRLELLECARAQGGADGLPSAEADSAGIVDGPLRLFVGPMLGEGGMGTVRHGVQTNLGRAVAVKMLREETRSGAYRLLQEARLTARLQHPNIVPVHEIIQGPAGELQIVLKQVEGLSWASVMHDPAMLQTRFGVEDALDWNLGVLIAICNALAFAHERGVIHRDVKPRNVMVGSFGEVYLLDWGIAAQWGERTDPDLAHVEDAPIAGTPAFMAPEQLEGDADALGPWTDVYLLGATLYEILAQRAPHADTDRSSSRGNPRGRVVPPLNADVPQELVEIAHQALAPNPEDRPLSPQAFRALIESFRSHRGSLDLASRAERSRRRATDGDPAAAEQCLGEAEFGFRAALEAWPENVRAREGLREIALERTKGARAAWHQDPTVGVAVRGVLLLVFAPFWICGWLALAIWPPATSWPLVGLLVGFMVLGTAVVVARGVDMLKNQLNRSNVLGAASALAAALLWTLSAHHQKLGMTATQLGLILVFTLTPAVFTVTSDRRGLLPSVANLGCFVFASFVPEYAGHALAASALVLAMSTAINNIRLQRQARSSKRAAFR